MNVDLYFCDASEVTLDDEALLASLPEDEVQRANRFRFARHRHTFCVAHTLMRLVLGRRIGCRPDKVKYEYGPAGKPALVEGPAFNLSHTDTAILFGVTDGGSLGVDIERRKDVSDLDALAQRCFSESEFARYQSSHPDQRINSFYRVWTRKEAFIKAIGGGLSIDLQAFSVSQEDSLGNVLVDARHVGVAEGWAIRALTVNEHTEAAVALDQVEFELATHRCSAELQVLES